MYALRTKKRIMYTWLVKKSRCDASARPFHRFKKKTPDRSFALKDRSNNGFHFAKKKKEPCGAVEQKRLNVS